MRSALASQRHRTRSMSYAPPRTTTLLAACTLPALVLLLILASLVQPAIAAGIGLAGMVGVGIWLANQRRRSTELPVSARRPTCSRGVHEAKQGRVRVRQ